MRLSQVLTIGVRSPHVGTHGTTAQYTDLIARVWSEDPHAVEEFLDGGGDSNVPRIVHEDTHNPNRYALVEACKLGNIDIIKMLLRRPPSGGITKVIMDESLIEASSTSMDRIDIVRLFVPPNAHPETTVLNDALAEACEQKNFNVVCLLLTHDANSQYALDQEDGASEYDYDIKNVLNGWPYRLIGNKSIPT